MFKTLELPGGFAPLAPYQGFDLDPLGALSGPQTPRPIILHPPFLIPGYGPGPLAQILAPATDGRLAVGQSQISQSNFCNTGMNGTGRFKNIYFNNGLFDTGNHDTCLLGLGTNTQSLYIGGLSMGDQEQSGRLAPVLSTFDNVGSHVPMAIRDTIWAGSTSIWRYY